MSGEGGWLARVARRLGDMVGATREDAPGATSGDARGFWAPMADERAARPGGVVARDDTRQDISGESRTGVRHDGNGRYVVAGWTFSTLEQALEFEAEQEGIGPGPSGPVATPVDRVADTRHDQVSTIRQDDAGRFLVGGWTFSTREQAEDFEASRAPAQDEPMPSAAPNPFPSAREAHRDTDHAAVAKTPAAHRTAPASNGREAPRWLAGREALSAGGVPFEADMVYFGTPLRHDARHDQSRIDPTLPVDMRGDPSGATLGYWPSYRDIGPRARATYLAWLSGGRLGTPVATGYLFVFLYGLEQRLLIDDARADAPAIFAELRRLMALHDQDYTFQSYASKLLALCALYDDEDDTPPTVDCARNWEAELPLDLRIRLGRRLRDGRPFSADDALRWVLAMPDVHLRTPGQRCFSELRELWAARFAARHPDGLSVRRPKKTVRHEYRAASGKFNVDLSVDELPDVSGISAPLGPLRAMLDLCIDDLSAFSRLVGRDPEARGRIHADLLLPPELRGASPALRAGRGRLATIAGGDRPGTASVAEIARLLDVEIDPAADRLPAAAARQLATTLDALDHGFEPDRRYGAVPSLRPDTPLALFPSHGGAALDHERPAYAAARTMVEIATLAAAADSEVVPAELEAIERRLRSLPDLAEKDVARLMAGCRALAADPPKVRSALKRLADIPPGQRAAVASSAVEAALADGTVRPAEVKFLEALHTALGLPAATLYSALHRGTEDEGPVLVDPGTAEPGVPIPPEPTRSSVAIDTARLERIRGETSRVSALLATIFIEEEQDATGSVPPQSAVTVATAAPSARGFDGLDPAHSDLLRRLVPGPMDRDAFEAAAGELRLMPDGAVETINEWGFDHFGEPVLEEDDGIRISPEVLGLLEPMGVAA